MAETCSMMRTGGVFRTNRGTAFLYDGANAAQELSGGAVSANLLSGGIDEMFSRTDSSGTVMPLQDALASTIALVDGSGNIATSYAYDPFGNTTSSGLVSSNPSQYTGRENDGNGLYFYRNRYYSPLLQRFISEAPLDFDGGDVNLYEYALSSPTNFIDPFGEDAGVWVLGGGIGTGTGADLVGGGAIATGGADVIVAVGAAAGTGGAVVAAGGIGWGVGRGIGHIPIGHGQTVDDGMQLIWTLLLYHNTPALAGRPLCRKRSNPFTGTPGSVSVTWQPNGQPRQVRRYGSDGYPETDIDYVQDHGQGLPHVHDWGRPADGEPPTNEDRGEGRAPQPGDPTPP